VTHKKDLSRDLNSALAARAGYAYAHRSSRHEARRPTAASQGDAGTSTGLHQTLEMAEKEQSDAWLPHSG